MLLVEIKSKAVTPQGIRKAIIKETDLFFTTWDIIVGIEEGSIEADGRTIKVYSL